MNKNSIRVELMELDKQFCKDSTKHKEIGWASYFAEDAIMISGGHHPNITGKKTIQEAMKAVYELKDIYFVWAPMDAIVSDDFSMGITYGNYTRSYSLNDKKYRETGKYTTVWQKVKNEWKITLDTGNMLREEIK